MHNGISQTNPWEITFIFFWVLITFSERERIEIHKRKLGKIDQKFPSNECKTIHFQHSPKRTNDWKLKSKQIAHREHTVWEFWMGFVAIID